MEEDEDDFYADAPYEDKNETAQAEPERDIKMQASDEEDEEEDEDSDDVRVYHTIRNIETVLMWLHRMCNS